MDIELYNEIKKCFGDEFIFEHYTDSIGIVGTGEYPVTFVQCKEYDFNLKFIGAVIRNYTNYNMHNSSTDEMAHKIRLLPVLLKKAVRNYKINQFLTDEGRAAA